MNYSLTTVFVGMSGGVDSSVAALRLKNKGYNVIGVFIKVWHPEFMICDWESERLDAMRVAAYLDIPFLTCDAKDDYRDSVAKYFISEYKAGRTPNPDVMCNQHVKFGSFLRFAEERGADFIATGHYAQRIDINGTPELHRGVDEQKDQSYFLWTLSSKQLSKTLFPIGNSLKSSIRQEAEAAGLPTATKKDSQGVCFLGHIDIPEFLSHYMELKEGKVIDLDGNEIGKHKGSLAYTLGQRHGFTLHTHDTERKPMFVVKKDIANNTITVSSERLCLEESNNIIISDIVLRNHVRSGEIINVQTRYRQKPFEVKIKQSSSNSVTFTVLHHTEKPASGQSCVLYRGTHCIGGGIIA